MNLSLGERDECLLIFCHKLSSEIDLFFDRRPSPNGFAAFYRLGPLVG